MARVLHLPDHGRLLVCTDLQGNLGDFRRMEAVFRAAHRETRAAHLLFTGDLIHGPHIAKKDWPAYLGSFYRDESGALVDALVTLTSEIPDRVHCILGNHEHAHIGGPHTAKFAIDEVILLESIVGPRGAKKLQTVFRDFPLVAVTPCGIVFTHGAPAADIRSANEVIEARLDGADWESPLDIFDTPVVGPILWARSATAEVARRFLAAMGGRLSVFGHDVIPEGYECIGDEQMIVSTSFGVDDANKVYLQLDLAGHYETVRDLREGSEILPLYPSKAAAALPRRATTAAT